MLFLVVLALYYFSQSPLFAVQRIEVEGLQRLTRSELIQESGLSKGQNIFRIDTNQVKKRLQKDPLIEQVAVKRFLPHTVIIRIKERQPRALFLAGSTLLVIDANGYCLDRVSAGRSYDLPVITGLKPSSKELGEKVSSSEDMRLLLAVLTPELQSFFSEFNLSERHRIIAYSREGIPILLGSSEDLEKKIEVAISLLKSITSLPPVEYIDVRAVNAPAVKYRNNVGGTGREKLYNTDKT
ncbi:MAG: cell division protein FtsQ/DivIB [Thermacetogeniaceae bacterium]